MELILALSVGTVFDHRNNLWIKCEAMGCLCDILCHAYPNETSIHHV